MGVVAVVEDGGPEWWEKTTKNRIKTYYAGERREITETNLHEGLAKFELQYDCYSQWKYGRPWRTCGLRPLSRSTKTRNRWENMCTGKKAKKEKKMHLPTILLLTGSHDGKKVGKKALRRRSHRPSPALRSSYVSGRPFLTKAAKAASRLIMRIGPHNRQICINLKGFKRNYTKKIKSVGRAISRSSYYLEISVFCLMYGGSVCRLGYFNRRIWFRWSVILLSSIELKPKRSLSVPK